MTHLLQTIADGLEHFPSQFRDATQTGTIPQLHIPSDDYSIVLTLSTDLQSASGLDVSAPSIDYLQCFARLPISMNPQYFAETTLLLTYLNARMPLLGFIVTADAKTIAFRYLYVMQADDVHVKVMSEIISTIQFLITTFRPAIESIATGKETLQQVLEQLEI